MKIRQYPGRATAIGASTMEFQYEANWQEVTEKWAIQDREKRTAQTVKDISRIGVKLPGLAERTNQEKEDNTGEADNKLTTRLEHPFPSRFANSSVQPPVDTPLSGSSDTTRLPLKGFQLKRSSSDVKPRSGGHCGELEQRYQIITPKDVGSIPESLVALVRKQTDRDDKNDSEQTRQGKSNKKGGNKSRQGDEQSSLVPAFLPPSTTQAKAETQESTDIPKPLPRSMKPLHQRNPDDVVTPPPPKMAQPTSMVTFRNEIPNVVPKETGSYLNGNVTTPPYEYIDFPPEPDDVPKPIETLELQPIPPSLKPVRVQPREDEIVSSWAARKRRELQQEKQRRRAVVNHQPYEDIESWQDHASLYNGNASKRGDDNLPSNVRRQESTGSDLLRDSFMMTPTERTMSLDSGKRDNSKTSPAARFCDYNNDSLEESESRLQGGATSPEDSTMEPDSLNPIASQESEFVIPRPKLIVPVHTYGIRKRRTGNMLHSSRRGSEAETVLSGHGTSEKKHHTSCPGTYYVLSAYLGGGGEGANSQ